MKKVIRLKDGPHPIAAASYFALQLMAENGFDVLKRVADDPKGEVKLYEFETLTVAPIILSALLTDAEPLVGDVVKLPERYWGPIEVAKLIDVACVEETMAIAWELVRAGLPESKPGEGSGPPPTPRRRGSKK